MAIFKKTVKGTVLVGFFLLQMMAYAQQSIPSGWKVGIMYGEGYQQRNPFNCNDYMYATEFFKAQLNKGFSSTRKWSFELLIEPGIYLSEHQLLNLHYIQEDRGEDYLTQREEFTQYKKMKEYALNVGSLVRYQLSQAISFYALGSSGPMLIDTKTERLAKGLAFSDVFALGSSFQVHKVTIDIRYSLRHISNANLYYPNSGMNSSNFEAGFMIDL